MTPQALEWPALFWKLSPLLALAKNGEVDNDGWVTARCIFTDHSQDDRSPALRLNTRTGAVRCFKCDFKGTLNDVAKALDVSIYDDDAPVPARPSSRTLPKNRTPSLEEMSVQRMLPVEVLRFNGITPTAGGWFIAIDDPDIGSFQRKKALPGEAPKYIWSGRGVKAADLVYGLSRVEPERTEVLIAAGEPDKIVLTHAGYPAISFLAGENSAPSDVAIQKVLAALPKLKAVSIIYDRDAAGRAGARKVADKFLSVGKAVDICALPDSLPEKGDVTDLWKVSGAVRDRFSEALDAVLLNAEHLEPREPRIEVVDFNYYTVNLPFMGGSLEFKFDGLERRGRDINAEVSGRIVDVPAFPKRSLTPTSMNLYSHSGRDNLRKDMDMTFGANADWHSLIGQAFEMVRESYFGATPIIDLFEAQESEMEYLIGDDLRGFAPLGDPTIIFGDGGTSKTNIGVDALIAVAYGRPFQGMPTKQMPVMMIDAEANQGTIRSRVSRRLQALGLTWDRQKLFYWPANGRPLSDMAEAIRREIRAHGIGCVLNDSVALLCSGKPEDAVEAKAYFQWLKFIDVTSLNIAHVTKDDGRSGEQRRPFGSAVWHNSARATWNVQRVQDSGARSINVSVWNRKMNDDLEMPPFGIKVTFDGRRGPIYMDSQAVTDVPEFAEKVPLKDRIKTMLAAGPRTVDEIADEFFPNAIGDEERRKAEAQVRARLNDLEKGKAAKKWMDGRWSLLSDRQEEAS